MSHLPRFSTGPHQAHLQGPSSHDIVNSIDSNDFAGRTCSASQALLLGHTLVLTNSEGDFSAWQTDPMAYAAWSQEVISHKVKFKAACQVRGYFAVDLAHPAVTVTLLCKVWRMIDGKCSWLYFVLPCAQSPLHSLLAELQTAL